MLYRVLMVCHVEFCYNFGEKKIKNKLVRWVLDLQGVNFQFTKKSSSEFSILLMDRLNYIRIRSTFSMMSPGVS